MEDRITRKDDPRRLSDVFVTLALFGAAGFVLFPMVTSSSLDAPPVWVAVAGVTLIASDIVGRRVAAIYRAGAAGFSRGLRGPDSEGDESP